MAEKYIVIKTYYNEKREESKRVVARLGDCNFIDDFELFHTLYRPALEAATSISLKAKKGLDVKLSLDL